MARLKSDQRQNEMPFHFKELPSPVVLQLREGLDLEPYWEVIPWGKTFLTTCVFIFILSSCVKVKMGLLKLG